MSSRTPHPTDRDAKRRPGTFVDRFPTTPSNLKKMNSLSFAAGVRGLESIRLYTQSLAIALLITVQALNLRAYQQSAATIRALLAPATRRIYEALCAVLERRPRS